MVRIDGDGPTDHVWRAAVVVGLALVAGAFALALVYPMVLGPCPCRDPDGRLALVAASSRDLWVAVEAARYVANGALGFVYESSPALTALPLYPILLAPLVAVGDALGLSGPPAPTATMYLLLAPFTVGLAVPLLHQVRGLLRDAGDRASALPVQLWTALLVVVPVLVLYGHGEDALALLAVLAAVRLTARGRWAAAGLVLGVAIASKQWALLVLSVDWPHASRALLHPPNYPGFGHAAPWVEAGVPTVATAPFRLGVLAVAVVLAGRARAGTSWSRLLAVLGIALLARCAFEPVVHVYYLAPGLCLLLLHERVTSGRCARTAVAGGLLVAWFAVHPAPVLWWAVAALLGVAVAYRAGAEVLGRGPGTATAASDSSATGSHQ